MIMIFISVGLLMLSLYIFARNEMVGNYRRNLLYQIAAQAAKDIDQGKNWLWRYDIFASVSYHKMMYQFWKPVDDFYPDKRFIQP